MTTPVGVDHRPQRSAAPGGPARSRQRFDRVRRPARVGRPAAIRARIRPAPSRSALTVASAPCARFEAAHAGPLAQHARCWDRRKSGTREYILGTPALGTRTIRLAPWPLDRRICSLRSWPCLQNADIARVERFWPYVEKPEEPTPRSWRRSIPICTRRCSGRASCRFRSRSCSRASTARTTTRAVEQAQASAEYPRDRRRRRPPPPRPVLFDRRPRAARSLRARRTGARHRSADRRSARAVRARAVAAAAVVSAAGLIVVAQPPKTEFEREMTHLEAEIRRLEAEFNMFFAGRLPRPPWETRARVEALVKRTISRFIRNTADRFRFEIAAERASRSSASSWERQMTNAGARPPDGERRAASRRPPPTPRKGKTSASTRSTRPRHASTSSTRREPSVAQGRIKRDPDGRKSRRVKELYEQLAEARRSRWAKQPIAVRSRCRRSSRRRSTSSAPTAGRRVQGRP